MNYPFPNSPDASEDMPQFSQGTAKDGGWFKEFNPETGELPTIVSADFLNMILLELRNFAELVNIPENTDVGDVLSVGIVKKITEVTNIVDQKITNNALSQLQVGAQVMRNTAGQIELLDRLITLEGNNP